jgi:heme exporter protein D
MSVFAFFLLVIAALAIFALIHGTTLAREQVARERERERAREREKQLEREKELR